MIATILRSAKSLKDIDILIMKLIQQPGKNPLKNKTKFYFKISLYVPYFKHIRYLLIKVIKYMVNSHLSVRRIWWGGAKRLGEAKRPPLL